MGMATVRRALGFIFGFWKLPEVLPKDGEEIDGADQTTGGNAQNGSARGQRYGTGGTQQKYGGGHANGQPNHGLHDLGDGGWHHIALTLEEAPEGGDNADKQNAGA